MQGLLSTPITKYIHIEVVECNQAALPEGEICASTKESDAHLAGKFFLISIKTNFVEFHDI